MEIYPEVKKWILEHEDMLRNPHTNILKLIFTEKYQWYNYKEEDTRKQLIEMLQHAKIMQPDEYYINLFQQFVDQAKVKLIPFLSSKGINDVNITPKPYKTLFELVQAWNRLSIHVDSEEIPEQQMIEGKLYAVIRSDGYDYPSLYHKVKLKDGKVAILQEGVYVYAESICDIVDNMSVEVDRYVQEFIRVFNDQSNEMKKLQKQRLPEQEDLIDYTQAYIKMLNEECAARNYNVDISYVHSSMMGDIIVTIKLLDLKKVMKVTLNRYATHVNTVEGKVNETISKIESKMKANPNAPKPLDFKDIEKIVRKHGLDIRMHFTNKYATGTTTYKLQDWSYQMLIGNDKKLNEIKQDLVNIGFNVKDVVAKDSWVSGHGSIPTLYIKVYH